MGRGATSGGAGLGTWRYPGLAARGNGGLSFGLTYTLLRIGIFW